MVGLECEANAHAFLEKIPLLSSECAWTRVTWLTRPTRRSIRLLNSNVPDPSKCTTYDSPPAMLWLPQFCLGLVAPYRNKHVCCHVLTGRIWLHIMFWLEHCMFNPVRSMIDHASVFLLKRGPMLF